MNTFNITLVGVHYKIEDTASGDASYFPRASSILKSNKDNIYIETTGYTQKGFKTWPYTNVQVNGVVQPSAQGTIDAIAALT